jgi:acyl-CoA thioesterase-1
MRLVIFLLSLFCVPLAQAAPQPPSMPVRIVMLGDSLTSGYGLPAGVDLASVVEQRLSRQDISARVENAGVGGDTSAGGLARLDWSIAGNPAPALVIVGLGGNDFLRGIDPTLTHKNLAMIIEKLQAKSIPVLLLGMKSPPNMGAAYVQAFDGIYPDLAEKYKIALYPFFLEGVAAVAAYNQPDGIHPNEKGLDLIASQLTPYILKIINP